MNFKEKITMESVNDISRFEKAQSNIEEIAIKRDMRQIRSISNPSIESYFLCAEDDIDQPERHDFNEEYMTAIYTKYDAYLGHPEEFMPMEVLKQVNPVMELMASDDNITSFAIKFYDSIMHVEDAWSTKFSNSAERNCLKFSDQRGYPIEYRIMTHITISIRSLKTVCTLLLVNKLDEAMKILDLVVLAHVTMSIQFEFIKRFMLRMVQTLMHVKYLNEDTLSPFVFFVQALLKYIMTQITYWQREHSIILLTMKDGSSAPARAHYRALRKWKEFVVSMYKALAKPLAVFENEVGAGRKINIFSAEPQIEEPWKMIKFLKRGYKYKKRNSTTF